MCQIMEEIFVKGEERGEARGLALGIKQGEERGIKLGIKQGEARGIKLGVKQGEERGSKKEQKKIIIKLLKKMPFNEVADTLDMTVEEVEKIIGTDEE